MQNECGFSTCLVLIVSLCRL